jgi:hypothetical protein
VPDFRRINKEMMMVRSREQYAAFARWRWAAAVGVWCLFSSMMSQAATEPKVVLRTGFETDTVVLSGKPTHDFLRLKLPSGQTADFGIQYEGGTPADRHARVIDDPTKPGNKVLEYWLNEARVPGMRKGRQKGRIQLNLVEVNKTSLYQRVRMYLHPDLAHYRSYPKEHSFFTINELWFGAPWKGDDYPFRISLQIVKEKGVRPLLLAAAGSVHIGGRKGAGHWKDLWGSVNKDFEVPVGEWLDVEVGYQQGNAQSGRFYVAVKPQSSGVRTKVLDVTNWTYHPQAPRPVPLTHWQPLKVYASGDIIDHVRNRGGAVRVYWDDLEISEGTH